MKLYFITLVTRPDHLALLADSIYCASLAPNADSIDIAWRVLFDASKLPPSTTVALPPRAPVDSEGYWLTPEADWFGEPYLRNVALDLVPEGHIAWLDDDNLVHPQFLAEVASALRASPDSAIVFDQVDARGNLRLRAAPENMCYGRVDTAQVIAPRELYGNARFANRVEGTDGVMFGHLYGRDPERFVFVSRAVTAWNALSGRGD